MTSATAIAGPLDVGVRVGLQLPGAGTCSATVACCDGRSLLLELEHELPEGTLEEGSVVDMFLPLSWGMYKWITIVSSVPGERKAEVQLLDAPMFIQRRLDPRVGAGILAEVRPVRAGAAGQSHRALVADLSHGGLKLEGARPLRAGEIVEVTMELTATLVSLCGPVTVAGRVVMAYPSTSNDEAGATDAHVSFLDGQARAIEAVDHFVAQQLKCRWKA